MKIAVTAGHSKSLHSIALMHTLRANGHQVVGCLQVKTFQFKRLKTYLQQYGWKTVKAKFQSHFLKQEDTYLANETKPIKSYLYQLGIEAKTIDFFCKKNDLAHLKVNSLNDEKAINFVKKHKIDLLIYSGGGILRKGIIQAPSEGVLNAHSGWLPFFRGMNVIEWSLLLKFPPHTTIHFIDAGIDTGKILYTEPIPYHTDLYKMRGTATVHNIELFNKVINNFEYYKKRAKNQSKSEGKQFFVMHAKLKQLLIDQVIKKPDHTLIPKKQSDEFHA